MPVVVPSLLLAALSVAVPTALAAPAAAWRSSGEAANVAHRGASRLAAENTLPAIRKAIAGGSDYVGIDVRRTRNDKLVVLHDASLARTTNVERVHPRRSPWHADDFTLRRIRDLHVTGAPSRVRVPSLAQALRLLEPSPTGALLEVKDPAPGTLRLVHRAVRRYTSWLRNGRRDRLVVQSFDEGFVHRYHRRHPAVTTSVLGRFTPAEIDSYSWADQLNMYFRRVLDRPRLVRVAHRNGLRVTVHTVDRKPRIRRVLDTGVDAVSTNRPARLRRVLVARAQSSARR